MQVVNTQRAKQLEQVSDQLNQITESVTLTASDLLSHASDAAGAVVVTLPTVAEAAGKVYSIYTTDASGGNGVDVVSQGDALYAITEVDPSAGTTIDLGSAVAIDTAGDFLCVFSTGVEWIVLAHRIQ